MTDVEISKALALAIGWTDDRIDADGEPDPDVVTHGALHDSPAIVQVWFCNTWRTFDYRDPTVIWPIAERYDAFPITNTITWWVPGCHRLIRGVGPRADTAAKAVAMAVIGRAK